MVVLHLVNGKKGPYDTLVLVEAYTEPLSLAEWLFIGKCLMDSEASYYSVENGFRGKAYLLNALIELSHGVPFEKVLEHYKLDRKGKKLNIVDKRKFKAEPSQVEVREEIHVFTKRRKENNGEKG